MKLRAIAIERMQGIDRAFELADLGDGLHILVGPNGIGKSRLCAAARALLWPERGIAGENLTARATFEHQGERWQVVRDGAHQRWQRNGIDAIPPTLPGERLDGCFFLGLRDLFDDSGSAGRDLAGEIRRQMSGGFDLEAVRKQIEASVPPRAGSRESKAIGTADGVIRRAEAAQKGIADREQQLASLSTQAEQAKRALQRLPHYERAIRLQATRRDHAQCLGELAQLPEAVARLDGSENERLQALDESISQKRHDRESAVLALVEIRNRGAASRLAEPLDAALLAAASRRANDLAELEHRLDTARENAQAAEQAAQESRRALGQRSSEEPPNGDDSESSLTVDDDADLFAFLRDNQQLTTKREALQERLNLLSAPEMSEAAGQRMELLRRGIGPLRDWLRAPDPALHPRVANLWPSPTLWLVAAIALVAIGVGVHLFAPASRLGIALTGVGLGLGVAGLLLRARNDPREATDWRSVAERQFPETIDAPARWSTDAVGERLRQLEDEVTKLQAEATRALYRAADRGQIQEALRSLEQPTVDLNARRQRLAERLRLDPERLDVEIVDAARALHAARTARAAARAATARAQALETKWQTRISEISTFLAEHGEVEARDPASARAGVESLKERDRTLRGSRAEAIDKQDNLDRLDRDIAALDAEKETLFRRAGVAPGDRAALMRMLLALPRYRELTHSCGELAVHIRGIEQELDAAGEAELAALDETRLDEDKAERTEESQHAAELNRQIGEIQQSARNAREGHELEEAIAKRSAVLGELHDRRDEAFAAAAGSFLIDAVRHEHERIQMPRVLERARNHLATFTHHRYELKVAPNDGASFVAVDASSGVGLAPDQLSDGTRAQLILAARLAFADEAALDAELPLFLDEALDHSDPERFHAIARSLARMVVDQGRQIFYLTNDPTDVERFRSAFETEDCNALNPLDLGVIRGLAARAQAPDGFHVPPLPSVPGPAGHTAESYGAAIGIAPLDPRRDAVGHSLYYLLRDDLVLLYEFLQARIETLGQCQNVLTGGSALGARLGTRTGAGSQLRARIELFETFCVAWREGRGRPVGRAEIEQSRAVSDTFLQAVTEIASELGGDAAQLVAALRLRDDPRLRGYRSRSANELEQFFVDEGFLDERPSLGVAEILERAIGTPAANQLPPATVAELVHLWWELSAPARGTGPDAPPTA